MLLIFKGAESDSKHYHASCQKPAAHCIIHLKADCKIYPHDPLLSRSYSFTNFADNDKIRHNISTDDNCYLHGAAPNSSFTHIAISPNTDKGSVVWLRMKY